MRVKKEVSWERYGEISDIRNKFKNDKVKFVTDNFSEKFYKPFILIQKIDTLFQLMIDDGLNFDEALESLNLPYCMRSVQDILKEHFGIFPSELRRCFLLKNFKENPSQLFNLGYPFREKIPEEIRNEFLNNYSKCSFCGETENLTLDHIIPVSKGGENISQNFQVLCQSCNSRKSNSRRSLPKDKQKDATPSVDK